MLAGVGESAGQIERDPETVVRVEQIGRTLQRFLIQRDGGVLFTLAVQFARLLDQLERIDLLSRKRSRQK